MFTNLILIIVLLGIGTGIFYICRWHLRKAIENTRTRKIINWIATIILTPAVAFGLIFCTVYIYNYYSDRDFNAKAWETNKFKRYEFSKNLINSKLLLNKSKKEVKILLGKPESIVESDSWEYFLGEEPSFVLYGAEFKLMVHFKKGKVDNVGQQSIE